ncbi:aldehyde dehydrogenase family protein [Streptomyces litchfieldiae]|uniref:Aldehyde dehydrogenase n=1 Tax=Streptomyces litchfieldiae TaxID=3075543 RepID=A0ABU2MZH7_9ACTN|nr:aldehyde dehydrogenase [Streptomyces sp. DSM 44938]MDT0347062.1 aldehyde dehydrogenase [Streptomyces sp. DSM 44938]
MRSYPQYINGADRTGTGWTYTADADAFLADPRAVFRRKRRLERATSPADTALPTGEDARGITGRVALSAPEDIEDALAAAHRAREPWAAIGLDTRIELLNRTHRVLGEHRDELLDILMSEGHPRRLASWEIDGMLTGSGPEITSYYRAQAHQHFHTADHTITLIRKPDGVVCLSPPQNASTSNSALGIGALAAGNTLVVKAPRTSPLGVAYLYRDLIAPILDALGAPPGTLNIVSGPTQPILRQWIASPHVNDIMYFGDSDTGLQLGAQATAHGKKPILELAGNDGVVIWHDADLDRATHAIAECFYGSGQICMVPKYAIAHPAIADRLIDKLIRHCATLRPGYAADPGTLLTPVLKIDRFYETLTHARANGCGLLCGGQRVDIDGSPSATGPFLEPTLLRVPGLRHATTIPAVTEETFYPLMPVIVPGPDDAAPDLLSAVISFLNDNPYGLRNSLWTSDPGIIETFTQRTTNAGHLKINTSHIAFSPYLSTHGGTGRTGGPHGQLNYPHLSTTHLQGITQAHAVV